MTADPGRLFRLATGLTRREFGRLTLAGAASAFLGGGGTHAQEPAVGSAPPGGPQHGFAAFGPVKYGPDFRHFDYADPDAPKGGRIVTQGVARAYNQNFNTFDTLHIHVLRGNGAFGMPLTFATLMAASTDEIGSAYAYAARTVEFVEGGRALRFALDERARFHDGSPILASDVAFSILTLRDKGHENLASELRAVEAVEIEGERGVLVRIAEGASRSLALTVASIVPIFSAAWWEGRDFEASQGQAPLGSGPYRVGRFSFGAFIELERVPDFWAAELPVMAGRYNFDRLRYDYYRDRTASLESFKVGDTLFREEFTSKSWALDYGFPALQAGLVRREDVPDEAPSGGQGWFFNTRREKFKDPRVREAIGLMFDFEWTNANLMYGSYVRSASFYEKTEYKATGAPSPGELAILEPLRDRLPPAVFGEVPVPPVSDGSGRDRVLARRTVDILQAAGCRLDGRRMLLPSGEVLSIEFLDDDDTFEPHHGAFIDNLRRVGIDASYRVVDASQYTDRTRDFDFDMAVARYTMPLYPDGFIRQFFGSRSAQTPGSYNLAGIADPAIDAILDRVVSASTPDAFRDANRALDRTLRAGHYVIPQWHKATRWLAWWDLYERPAVKPRYDTGVLDTWWFVPEKAAAIGMAG